MPPKSATRPTITAARERAALIKREQDDALLNLPMNGLFIVLHIRSDPPRQNDFHWGLYFHANRLSGVKYHITNVGGSGWIPDHGQTSGVFKSLFLCALIQIAIVPEAEHPRVDQVIRCHDNDVNTIHEVTCRVWVMAILQKLAQHGVVRCNDLDALEQECMAIGNQYSTAAAKNDQPRPVVRSRLCF